MEYIGTTQAAFLLHLSPQRVRQLLAAGRIEGASKEGRFWRIPLFNGMPKVTDGTKGPKGSWRKHIQKVNTYIHVNQPQIRKNQKYGIYEPVISVHQGGTSKLCHGLEIPGIGRLIYQPSCPKNCGARVWLEINPDIKLNIYKFAS